MRELIERKRWIIHRVVHRGILKTLAIYENRVCIFYNIIKVTVDFEVIGSSNVRRKIVLSAAKVKKICGIKAFLELWISEWLSVDVEDSILSARAIKLLSNRANSSWSLMKDNKLLTKSSSDLFIFMNGGV